ncbi:MAG: hypothetical protein KJ899_15440 [Gammaproteobacteria bacterium]|nr:hypothetical protein [Gammaproteobacteria bacterium]
MYSFDAPQTGVSPVKFKNKERREEFVEYLKKEHDQAFRDRSGLEAKWKLWLDQYNSRRKRKGAKPRESQIDLPYTQRRTSRSIASLINPVFQQDQLMTARPSSPQYDEFAMSLEPFMEYITGKVDLRCIAEDWLEQAHIFNFGAIKTPFVRKVKYVKQWTRIEPEVYEELKMAGSSGILRREFKNGDAEYFIEEDREVVTFVGAAPEVVPIEDFVCPITTADVESADWISHRLWLTKCQIEERIRVGIYNEKDDGQKIIDILGTPYSERKKLLDYSTTQDEQGDSSSETSKQYEIMETYLAYDAEGDGKKREIIVTWDRKSGAILRCVNNFYHNFCRPFILHQFKRVHGSVFGVPATFQLEPMHVANSASFNQRLDAGSLANTNVICGPPGSSPRMKSVFENNGIESGFYEVNATKDEFWNLDFSTPFTQMESLEDKLEVMGDDLMQLSPYSRGQEQIQRPTATGMTTIVEENKQPTFTKLERWRASFSMMVLHMISRYRQFYPEGMTYYVESIDQNSRMALEQAILNWPEEAIEEAVIIETKVTSAQMSKNLRKQEVIAMLDRIPQLYMTMLQMAQGATQPGPMAMISLKMLHGMQTIVDRFLTEFEVPKKDQLNPDLLQEVQVAQMVQQQMAQMGQQVQQLQQQLAAATGQLNPGGGPGGPSGPPGPQQGVPGPPGMGGPPAGPVPQ